MADAYDFWAERISAGEQALVDRFWEKFAAIADDLDRAFSGAGSDIDPSSATIEAIGDLHDRGIFWEYGPGEQGHHLALSPELNHEARPLARALVNAAPDMPRWTFSDARPPSRLDDNTVALIEGRAQMGFPLTGITPSAGEHHRIDFHGTGDADEGTLGGMAGLTFSVLFGEAVERDWLGEVDGTRRGVIARLKGRPDPTSWLPGFVESAQEVLDDLMDGRPERPRGSVFSRDAEHTLFEVTPRDDAGMGSDLISYVTPNADLAQAMLAGARVSAVRFTRFPESFCGVAVERNEAHPFELVDDRTDLTEAINGALAAEATGGVTGEGHGTGHVYIDLAVTDIPRAIAMVEADLGRAGIAGPAWFTFHEAGLEERRLPLTPAARRH